MNSDLNELVDLFLDILHKFSLIEKKPWDAGTGSRIYLAEIQTVAMIGDHPDINMTQLSGLMGVTRGAVSQMVRKLVAKKLVTRTSSRNQKEINLGLTEYGDKVREAYRERMKEVFDFAGKLYRDAQPGERQLVKRLFLEIQANMEKRIVTSDT
jgi:DNA-binding MarR family transcriptional regulator